MQGFSWSPSEKKAARAAFDAALNREIEAARREVEAMLKQSADPREIWSVQNYLSEKRRDIDSKYDFRYSVLIIVFGRLISEGWLTESELAGLKEEKLEAIRHIVSFRKEQER